MECRAGRHCRRGSRDAGGVAPRGESQHRRGARCLPLVDRGGRELGKVDGVALERNAFAEARPREVEELIDHPTHALAAGCHESQDARRFLVARVCAEELRAAQDRAERVAKVVAQDADEHLADVDRARELLDHAGVLLFAALPVGDVVNDAEHARRSRPRALMRIRGDGDPAMSAGVGAQSPAVVHVRFARGERLLDARAHASAIVGVEARRQGLDGRRIAIEHAEELAASRIGADVAGDGVEVPRSHERHVGGEAQPLAESVALVAIAREAVLNRGVDHAMK
jgi:hypothetical protein